MTDVPLSDLFDSDDDGETHTTRIFVQQMMPTGDVAKATDVLGMWLLDMAQACNLTPEGGVFIELLDTDDLTVPAPDGWVAFNVVVNVHEAFDVEV